MKRYQVSLDEAIETNPLHYASYNDFFIRRLKPDARKISEADIVSPVDGCVSEIGYLSEGRLIQAKGHDYTVADLMAGDVSLYAQFKSGAFATLYLSPKDYHRVHMPLKGQLQEMIYVPGTFFSVQPKVVQVVPNIFARNERLIVMFSTELGPMAMILVGAAIVGSIGTAWHGDITRSSTVTRVRYTDSLSITLEKAMEMGYFKLGSTVILLFSDQKGMAWLDSLVAGSSVRLGQALGHAKPSIP